jgi:hypothetical protein
VRCAALPHAEAIPSILARTDTTAKAALSLWISLWASRLARTIRRIHVTDSSKAHSRQNRQDAHKNSFLNNFSTESTITPDAPFFPVEGCVCM